MIFDITWFEQHQRRLLWFVNTWIGRKFFQLDRPNRLPHRKRVIHIEPSFLTWFEGWSVNGSLVFGTNFLASDGYGLRLKKAFKPFLLVAHFLDWMLFDRYSKLGFSFGCLTTDFSTVSGFDGHANRTVGSPYETWSELFSGVGTAVNSTGGTAGGAISGVGNTVKFSYNQRTMCSFHTGTTLSGMMIISGTV